jgi:putative ABC transport system permease protein
MIELLFKRNIPLAWQQLIRQKGKFIVASTGIGFAVILILIQLGFKSALIDCNVALPRLLQADLVLISPQSKNFGSLNTFTRRRLFQARNQPEVESVAPLYVQLGNWQNPVTKLKSAILVLGFTPTQPVFNLADINQNTALLQYPDTYLFDRLSAPSYKPAIAKIKQGSKLTTELQNRKITVAGLFSLGTSFTADSTLVTSDQNFFRVFSAQKPSEISLGLINLKSGSDAIAVAQKLNSQLPNDVKVLTRQAYVDAELKYWQTETSIGFIFSLGVVVGFVVGVIVVYQIIYSDVSEHLPEYATLKAMGYKNVYLIGVIFQQVLILAVVGFIPASLISFSLYEFIRNATNLPLALGIDRVIEVFILTVVMCLISGAITLQKLSSADPAEIF